MIIALLAVCASALQDEGLRPAPLQSRVTHVQPMTGLVFWADSEQVSSDAIQLEFSYLKYGDVVSKAGVYDWAPVERVLGAVAGRKHQAVLRFYDTYVGQKTTVPDYIKKLPDYKETAGLSEKKQTWFPDWSMSDWAAMFWSKVTVCGSHRCSTTADEPSDQPRYPGCDERPEGASAGLSSDYPVD